MICAIHQNKETYLRLQKRKEYGASIYESESESFTPFGFSTTGNMGKEGLASYSLLAELLSICD